MKEPTVSICEKNFVENTIKEDSRLDGRKHNEFRKLNINFGSNWGSVHVSLGETRVLAQLSCEIQQPKTSRPNEGLLNINVEISPMAAPFFEIGRQSDLSVQLNRLLEKCLKDSKAVDLESLCIVADDKVWALRVDINILNHEGNLIDCASVAALTALAHFRHPDVTLLGTEITVHKPEEQDPIPIIIHHYPVYVSFALFETSDKIIADPTYLEECISAAQIHLGINSYKELCGLHLGGSALASPDLILQCTSRASKRASEVVQLIKDAIKHDVEQRNQNNDGGFVECLRLNKITSLSEDSISIKLRSRKKEDDIKEVMEDVENMKIGDDNEATVTSNEDNFATMVPDDSKVFAGGVNQWKEETESETSEDSDDDVKFVEEVKCGEKVIELSDSEEDCVIVLNSVK